MIEAPARFNLRERIRGIARESSDPRPAYIAERVLESLTDAQRTEALLITLPDYVRSVITLMATDSRKAQSEERTTMTRFERLGWYNRTLTSPTFNGEEWKFFREFTATDVHGAAALRYAKALANQVEGDRLTRLADLMEKYEYATVGDIPEAELREVFDGKS